MIPFLYDEFPYSAVLLFTILVTKQHTVEDPIFSPPGRILSKKRVKIKKQGWRNFSKTSKIRKIP